MLLKIYLLLPNLSLGRGQTPRNLPPSQCPQPPETRLGRTGLARDGWGEKSGVPGLRAPRAHKTWFPLPAGVAPPRGTGSRASPA